MTEAEILKTTYEHTATVFRPSVKEDVFDEYKMDQVYADLPCAISFTGTSTQGASDTVQRVEYVAVLFAMPDVVIEPGDVIKTVLQGRMYEFLAGESAPYLSHIEVPLIREAVA